MTSLFTRRRLALTAVATAIGAASIAAIAQSGPAPQMPPMGEAHAHAKGKPMDPQRHAERLQHMQERMAEHQARLKASLQLTPQQEPAWNAFVARMQPQPRPEQPRMDRDAWKGLSTPERLDRMEALKAERDKAMAQRHDAIRSFYAQLTPSQQKAFDAQQGMGMMRAGMRGPGMHGHHDGEHRPM
ncbi:MAG: Spy/CpxP family protein refolding chaperone [Hydrogenophaga sp.]|uniref:Spy/CpxP family protein refolding chaperone n=1 Tax=Hydrogenophaga sp. TaxID=1904254 RepID=UPI001DB69297|nr:Spy/CpxP family protein refolding chaperone [Hydrogenophaga sp.]MBX3608893.1 Spy/CpxP family protein refolding chaperone [Hydrogenophaga sp.]